MEDGNKTPPRASLSQGSDSMFSNKDSEEQLSPIVGYIFGDEDDESSSSDTDDDTRTLLNAMNEKFLSDKPMYQSNHADRWKKLRKKRRKIFANLDGQNKKSKQQSSTETTPTKPAEPMETDDTFMSSDDTEFRIAASKMMDLEQEAQNMQGLNVHQSGSESIGSSVLNKTAQIESFKTMHDTISDEVNSGPSKSIDSILFETKELEFKSKQDEKTAAQLDFVGFKTASGKTVKISETAIQKAKALMDETDKAEGLEIAGLSSKNSKKFVPHLGKKTNRENLPIPPKELEGLFSASGKPVTVSKQAIQQSRALLSSSEEKFNRFSPDDKDKSCDEESNKIIGFKTASGKAVKISAEAILKAKSLLADVDDCTVPECNVESADRSSKSLNLRPEVPVAPRKSPVKRKSFHRGFKPPFRGPVVDRAALNTKVQEIQSSSSSAIGASPQCSFVGSDKTKSTGEGMTQEVQESIMALLEDDDDGKQTTIFILF